MSRLVRVALLTLALVLFAVPLATAQDAPLNVVATTSIVADLVRQVAGDRVNLTVLAGPGEDPHVYQPTAQDARALAGADIIVEIGLEYETWLDALVEASGSTAERVVISEGVALLAFDGHDHDDHDHDEDGHTHDHEEVTGIDTWQGAWFSGYAIGEAAMQPVFDAVLATVPELTQANIDAYYTAGNATSFNTFVVDGTTVTFDDALSCTYTFLGNTPMVQFPTEMWSQFTTTDAGCAAYATLLLNPPHAAEAGSTPHFHMRYGAASPEAVAADDSPWFPSLYPQGATNDDVLGGWLANPRAVGLYIASTQGVSVALLPEEQQAAEDADHDEHDHADDDHNHQAIHEGDAMRAARLVVNDFESGTVHVVDLNAGTVIATFELAARPTLYTGASGRYAFAVQADANRVQLVDSGITLVPHDDHFDLSVTVPSLTGAQVQGGRPIHFAIHHGQVAVFNDGDGTATVFTERDVLGGVTPTLLTTARPHHGVAVPLGDVVLLSTPNPDVDAGTLPIGVDAVTLDGTVLASLHDCPGLHGEAAVDDDTVAFACADGIMVVARDGDSFTSSKLAYPNPDVRSGTLYATAPEANGTALLVGNYGDLGLLAVDVVAGTVTLIETPSRVWRFATLPDDAEHAVALTMDGQLHRVHLPDGEVEGSVQVVDPFLAPASGRAAARPAIAVSGTTAYVSEPLPGDIAVVDLTTMTVGEARIAVGGKPSSLAAFGMVPLESDDHDDHDHDDDHDDHADHNHDDHAHGEFDPHVWLDVTNTMILVDNIAAALAAADAANAETYTANAAAYNEELAALDAYIREQAARVPEQNRLLVNTHEALAYFAQAYGFEVLGTVLGAVTTEVAEPNAQQFAALVDAVRETGVPAVFVERAVNPALMESVAADAGVTLAPPLYLDTLGTAGSSADTYINMMRANIDVIVAALAPQS